MARPLSGEQVAALPRGRVSLSRPRAVPGRGARLPRQARSLRGLSGTAARPAPRTAPREDASAVPVARRPHPPPGGGRRRRGPDRPGPARLPPHDVDQGAGRRRVRLLASRRNVLRARSRGPARHRLGRADGQPAGDGLCHGAAGQSSAGPAPAHHASRHRQPPVQRPAATARCARRSPRRSRLRRYGRSSAGRR